MKNIVIDKRLNRFVRGYILGKNEDVLSIHLDDIDESFYFDDPDVAQDFLNKQSIERFGDKELRKGYFDYIDEHETIHRYRITPSSIGKIIGYTEEVGIKLSEKEMLDKFGYLMDKEHGDDIELLVDILECYGNTFEQVNDYYFMFCKV